jgi:hypothetical protein
MITAEAQRHTVNADLLLGFARELRQTAIALSPAGSHNILPDRARGLLDAADRLHHLLDDLARDEQGRR